jgi:hypothetical protein
MRMKMRRDQMILLIVSMLFGYLVVADAVNKVINHYAEIYPKVECVNVKEK